MRATKLFPALALLLAAIPALAQAPAVVPGSAWSRATPPGATVGAAYLTLTSPAGDTLTAVSSPLAAQVQVHEMAMDGPVMRMRELPGGLTLPPGQAVTLQPGGLHLMMLGLKAPLRQGDTVPLHLTFAHAPPLDLSATVAAIGATAPQAAAHH